MKSKGRKRGVVSNWPILFEMPTPAIGTVDQWLCGAQLQETRSSLADTRTADNRPAGSTTMRSLATPAPVLPPHLFRLEIGLPTANPLSSSWLRKVRSPGPFSRSFAEQKTDVRVRPALRGSPGRTIPVPDRPLTARRFGHSPDDTTQRRDPPILQPSNPTASSPPSLPRLPFAPPTMNSHLKMSSKSSVYV